MGLPAPLLEIVCAAVEVSGASEFPASLSDDAVAGIVEIGEAFRPATTLRATDSASCSEGSFGPVRASVWIRGETRSGSFSRFGASDSVDMRLTRALPTDRCIIEAARARLGAPAELVRAGNLAACGVDGPACLPEDIRPSATCGVEVFSAVSVCGVVLVISYAYHDHIGKDLVFVPINIVGQLSISKECGRNFDNVSKRQTTIQRDRGWRAPSCKLNISVLR